MCSISESGREHVRLLAELTRAQISSGQPLARTAAERICRYVDAMGSVYCTAGELVMLALRISFNEPCTVTQLVDSLGLLQPTVSMSVSTLIERGLVTRDRGPASLRSTNILLTSEGKDAADEIVHRISSIIVHRKPRA